MCENACFCEILKIIIFPIKKGHCPIKMIFFWQTFLFCCCDFSPFWLCAGPGGVFCSALVYHRGTLVRAPPASTHPCVGAKKKSRPNHFGGKSKHGVGAVWAYGPKKQSQIHRDHDKSKTENTHKRAFENHCVSIAFNKWTRKKTLHKIRFARQKKCLTRFLL